MGKQVQINLTPASAADDAAVKKIAASLTGIDPACHIGDKDN